MDRPKLLDLFSGAGGAARGYQMAGFHVTGIDIKPQPRYAGDVFIQGDALEYLSAHGHEYDVIHASPPCQAYSAMRCLPWLKDKEYWDSIPPTRSALEKIEKTWVIENVERAPMQNGITLCGTMFGLKVYRHRRFESNVLLFQPQHIKHREVIGAGHMFNDRRGTNENGWVSQPSKAHWKPVEQRQRKSSYEAGGMVTITGDVGTYCGPAMGVDWMNGNELSQAIPPAYTKWIGSFLMTAITSHDRSRVA